MQIKKIILVFKTHFDIGFTKLSSEIMEYYSGEMLDQVSETCAATRNLDGLKYVWTMPAWPLKIMLQSGEDRAAIVDDLVHRKQLAWHALPFTSHYDFAGIGDSLWGMNYARELSERYGMPLSRAAKMTDVPGHGRFLPEMLADAGVKLLHLGCNEFATPPAVPPMFWWEAPSGKRVLTMYNRGYGTGLYPTEDWPFETWMSLMNTQDNSGPQTSDLVMKMQAKLSESYPEAEIVCGTLEDMLEALEQENLDSLPVVRGDLADSWIHGVASYPRESAIVRRLRGRLNRVNYALTGCEDPAVVESIGRDVAQAYDAMALYDEHTWGLDVKTWLGKIPDYEEFDSYRKSPCCLRMEQSWKEQMDRVASAAEACERAEAALGISIGEKKEPDNWMLLTGECSLTGGNYRIDFSADTGVIHALCDLNRGCTLLKERGGMGVFAYRYDRYGADDMTEYLRSYGFRFSDWGILDNGRAEYPECPHTVRMPVFERCEQSGNTVRFVYRACDGERIGDAEKVILTVAMPKGDGSVRVRVELKNKKATPYVESGSVCMPLGMDKPRYFINKTGSVLDPETDIAEGANHAFYALEHFAAAQDEHAMVSVVSHDAPLVSLGENGVYVFRRNYKEHAPELRFCLFNNMWGTNFPQWIEGDMSFEFDVFAENANAAGKAYGRAAALAENPDGAEMPAMPFALTEGLRFASVFAGQDAVILHVHNCEGVCSEGILSADGWRFTEVDLLGRVLSESADNCMKTAFAPYDLRTFRAEQIR